MQAVWNRGRVTAEEVRRKLALEWRMGLVGGLVLLAVAVPVLLVAASLKPAKQGPSGSGTAAKSAALPATSEIASQSPPQPGKDSLGDPLPEGARLRLGTLRFREPSSVDELALSPDDKSIVTINAAELVVWDAATGKQRWRANTPENGALPGAAYGVRALAFGSDNASFCTPGGRNTIIVWDVASGHPTVLPYKDVLPAESADEQSGRVKAVDVTADGKKVAVGSSRGVVVWGRRQVLLSVANKPDAAVTSDRMNSDRLWFGGHYSFGRFSPDGKVVAVVTSDLPEAIRLFDSETGRQLRRITLKSALVRLAFSPDGKRIVTTERDVAVRQYATESDARVWSREIEPVKNAECYTSAVAYSPDAKTIAAGAPIGPDNSIYLLDAATGNVVGKLLGHTWKPWGLAFTADSKMLYSSGWDGVIRRWDVAARKQLAPPGGVRATGVCAASPDGRTLAYADDSGTIHLVDAASGASRRTIELPQVGFDQLTFSADGQMLAAGGTRGDQVQVMLWNATTGGLLRRWEWPRGRDPESSVESLGFTPDGNRLAAAVFRQHSAYLWDLTNGRRIARLPHQHVYGLSFSPDGKTLATAGWDRIIRFWETETGKIRKEINVAENAAEGSPDVRMYAVCYAPTGGLIATAHLDGTVRLWHADSMKLRQGFEVGGRFLFGAISFSPDGLWLATGAMDGTVSLWDPLTADRVADVGAHEHHVYTVGFGRDSRTLLTGGGDGLCYLWDLRPRGKPSEKDPARLWSDLVGTDSAAAYRAMWGLAGMPGQAVTLLVEKTHDWEKLAADSSTDEQSTAARRAVSVLAQICTPDAIRLLEKWAKENHHGILGPPAAEALKRASRASGL